MKPVHNDIGAHYRQGIWEGGPLGYIELLWLPRDGRIEIHLGAHILRSSGGIAGVTREGRDFRLQKMVMSHEDSTPPGIRRIFAVEPNMTWDELVRDLPSYLIRMAL